MSIEATRSAESGALTATPPLVTIVRNGNHRVLAAVDAVASALGLCPGMRLAQAQALVPSLAIRDHDPDVDAAALRRLAGWCLRYSPLVAVDPPDGLWIDVTGSTHLFGDEARMLHDLVQRLTGSPPVQDQSDQGPTADPPPNHGISQPRHPTHHPLTLGWATRVAVADTPAVAHAVARFGGQTINVVPPGAAVLANLPIEALRLPAEVTDSLRLMGFTRIGPLAAAARAPLIRRFGIRLANRLDQASGKLFEPIEPTAPPELIQVQRRFVEPLLTTEAFTAVIARLTVEVCTEMERAGNGARRMHLVFERVDGTVQVVRVGSVRPIRDARHWGRMLDEHLERIDPGLGVEAMRLVVTAADKLDFIQTCVRLEPVKNNRPGATTSSLDIAPLMDRLINRLGEAQVYRIASTESDVPERSIRRAPPLSISVEPGWPIDLPRPVRLLDPPQPVETMALLPDYPPMAFTWRRVRHRVRRADGPERIAGEWWKRDGEMNSVRDYFRVEDEDGRRFWLFRRGNGSDLTTGDMHWFLHGFF